MWLRVRTIFSLAGRFQCFSLITNELVTDKLPKILIECSQPFHSEECTKLMFLNNTYQQAYYNQEKLLFTEERCSVRYCLRRYVYQWTHVTLVFLTDFAAPPTLSRTSWLYGSGNERLNWQPIRLAIVFFL